MQKQLFDEQSFPYHYNSCLSTSVLMLQNCHPLAVAIKTAPTLFSSQRSVRKNALRKRTCRKLLQKTAECKMHARWGFRWNQMEPDVEPKTILGGTNEIMLGLPKGSFLASQIFPSKQKFMLRTN